MTDQSESPVVTNPVDSPADINPKDTVSYDTHRKLLDEKKKIQAKFDSLIEEKKQQELADLTSKGETTKLLDLARKEVEELKRKTAEHTERETQARKLSAIIRGMGSNVEQKWFGVISQKLDDIILNPDTGEVEAMSVTGVVEELKKTWPEMLKRQAQGMPHEAPKGNGAGSIARDEWLKLPAKEMAKYKPDQVI